MPFFYPAPNGRRPYNTFRESAGQPAQANPLLSIAPKGTPEREQLEWLAGISTRHEDQLRRIVMAEAQQRRDRENLEWLASFSEKHAQELQAVLREEAEAEARRRPSPAHEDDVTEIRSWDSTKHPRLDGPPNAGWFAKTTGAGGSSEREPGTRSEWPKATHEPHEPHRFAAAGDAAAPMGPFGIPGARSPNAGAGTTAVPGAGASQGTAAGARAASGIAGAVQKNVAMTGYWAHGPGRARLLEIWAYSLERRVRAGELSHEDAVGIFGTAIKEAEAQKFEPTGDGSTAVHKSAMDFLTKAEDKYKKEKEAAAARQKADAEGAEAGSKRVTGEELEKRRREFDNMKPSLWKEEAKKNPQKYTPEQLDQMQKGKAPKGSDGEPMEIHHKKPLSEGGTNTWDNFEVMTRTDHRIKPNFKVNHPNLPRGRAK